MNDTDKAQVRATPEYSDGFWDCLHGRGFDADRNYDEPYCEGWQSGERALGLMDKYGFKRVGVSGFQKSILKATDV